ncbi:SDR family NAD(P)-dependent oxidoreductase [Nonomuraea sp. K274]|uniref:Probable oxidoreductase n=1 Tax=Nonomuraea cypriaca TaxID=1187855 RepID=A0A931ABV5_9ACTN|nr:SDR family NAD(P)-dependent oxidoreductase [Nonomuraea cypriaca]MBF8190107.1 SDR family NAD(P)-dependent oxidoreductase [Nonomuraea cypriaca]
MQLIQTDFNATSTAEDVIAGRDLSGLRAIVTGAAAGIGIETARALAHAGADVTLAVRDSNAGRAAAEDITTDSGSVAVHIAEIDLADRASVGRFVNGWKGPLHLLINNAGIMAGPLSRTREGWELQFATNHLGHFALARGLHSALAAGAAQRHGARIVGLSSSAHTRAPVDLDDLHFLRRPYDPWTAYAQSKTAVVLFCVEASRRWAADGIVANAVNPGGIKTGLQKHVSPDLQRTWDAAEAAGDITLKTPQQGAATTLVAALTPEFGSTGGHYLNNGNEAPTVPNDTDLGYETHAVRQWAKDPETARTLWDVSTALTDTAF